MSDSSILGIKPNQAPRNSMLGECAYVSLDEIEAMVEAGVSAAIVPLQARIAALEAVVSAG